MSKVHSYSVCIAIFQYSVINISIYQYINISMSTRNKAAIKAFIFGMYAIYVAGNCLVKFALITDSHLQDIGCQS